MCGISGKLYFDLNRKVSINELKDMTDVIQHRGPDDEGHFLDNNLGLGFRRLSIIDLKLGHQPLCDNSERYWITFNGEIYNYIELKEMLYKKGYVFKTNSDTEVIVNLYAEFKEKSLEYLRGMFAFVIWDKHEKILFGARDRFGIKPFYYYRDNEKMIWGSELKTIVLNQKVSKTIDLNSLDYYFAYGYTPAQSTIYENISKLKPGHYFSVKCRDENSFVCKPYWNIEFNPDYSKSEAYWKEELFETLNESVKLRMRSDVPLGAFLSGGIDSSIVVALMSLNSNNPIKTFSIGFKEEKYNELQYAKQVAERYQTDHHELIVESESIDLIPNLVKSYDEPFADASAIPTYIVSRFTRENVTVALSGDGGDELFAGYNSYSKMNNLFNRSLNAKGMFRGINKILPDHVYGKGLSYYLSKDKEHLGAYFCLWKDYERESLLSPWINQELLSMQSPESIKCQMIDGMNGDFLSKMQQLDMQTYLVDDILTKVDRSSMMNSLEARVPILDHKFAELSFRIPHELKMKDKVKKYILKEAFGNYLPEQVLSHKKKGFSIPLSAWFKGSWKNYAQESLLDSDKLFQYVNRNFVEQTLKNHQKGQKDFGAQIWSLVFFNEWLIENDI